MFWPALKITRLIETFSAVFSNINFFSWSGHCKELELIGNLFDCPQICEFFSFEIFFQWERFLYKHFTFFEYYFKDIPWLFTATEYGKTQTIFFSVLGPETEEQVKWAKDNIRCLTCSFEKMIRTLAFNSRVKFSNSFYFKIIGIVG